MDAGTQVVPVLPYHRIQRAGAVLPGGDEVQGQTEVISALDDRDVRVGSVTVVMRQAGFAVGIAVLGAVLHNQKSAISYVWLFSAAAVASAAGLVAALVLLPASTAPSKK